MRNVFLLCEGATIVAAIVSAVRRDFVAARQQIIICLEIAILIGQLEKREP